MEEKNLSKNDISRLRATLFGTLFILGAIYKYFDSHYAITFTNLFFDFIPGAVGGGIALGIIPSIIAVIRKIWKIKPTKGIYNIYFVIIVITFSLSMFSAISNMIYQSSSVDITNPKTESGINNSYSFTSNEYSVVFQSKPKITETSIPFNGTFFQGKTAELIIPNEKSFCRAEYIYFNGDFANNFDKNFVYKYLNDYAIGTGLSYPTLEYEENNLGKVGSLRAYKSLTDGKGRSVKVTYYTKSFYGKGSIMSLYVGCSSEYYPTQSITRFLNSITKN